MTTLFNIGDVVTVGRGLPPGHVRTPMFLVDGCNSTDPMFSYFFELKARNHQKFQVGPQGDDV